jgi:hypothetical protein
MVLPVSQVSSLLFLLEYQAAFLSEKNYKATLTHGIKLKTQWNSTSLHMNGNTVE